MATIQAKNSRGHKYWYIVESRRVNGKPRPVVLAYLGKAEDLLKRLTGVSSRMVTKSFSHGAVAALLNIAGKLNVPSLINQHVHSSRSYMPKKPLRNGLTVGITLVLGAIGRVCAPTSKRGWWEWAKTTSCEYLLRCALSRIDCQHFWDLMDALPVKSIAKIEDELLKQVRKQHSIEDDTLLFDTTNFFTFIDTTNDRCAIARRGKNKQKRNDLRQFGLALVVTRKDLMPLFHLTYQGNTHDSKVFARVIKDIRDRMTGLGLDMEKQTLVFDRGNNSKKNYALIDELHLHYVGALTPYHHKSLVDEAEGRYKSVLINGKQQDVYRVNKAIWGKERTALIFVSDCLKAGQIRGIHESLRKKELELQRIQHSLMARRNKGRKPEKLANSVSSIIKGQHMDGLIIWSIAEQPDQSLRLDYYVDQTRLQALEEELGFRIVVTDRNEWDTAQIIKAFYDQAGVEHAFKNLKNPYHLAVRPQFHWTDQKIAVHNFMCVLGFLFSVLLWKQARTAAHFTGTLDSLLDQLNNIRLATLIERTSQPGKPKVTYQLEQLSDLEKVLLDALEITDLHINRPKIKGVGVYEPVMP